MLHCWVVTGWLLTVYCIHGFSRGKKNVTTKASPQNYFNTRDVKACAILKCHWYTASC